MRAIVEPYILEALPEGWVNEDTVWHVNPTGKFVIGGPDGDAASPAARSSSTPMAARRPMAAAPSRARTRPRSTARPPTRRATSPRTSWRPGLADRCTIQLSYAIGVAKPLSIYVDLHGTGKVDEAKLEAVLMQRRSTSRRAASATHLGLNRPIYARTSAYGHFGRAPEADGGFSWERTDLADRSSAPACG